MSLASLLAVTTDFVNSDVSGGRWTPIRWLHSSTLLWTSPALGSLIAALVGYCTMNFTGSMFPTGCFSSWQWQFTDVWRPCTAVPVGLLRSGRWCRHSAASAFRQLLAVPRHRLNTYGCRAFLVAGTTVWNSLPDIIRDPTISADCFRRLLKRICSLDTSAFSAFEVLDDNCAI